MGEQFIVIVIVWNVIITLFLVYFWLVLRKILPSRGRGLRQTIEESIGHNQALKNDINELKKQLKKNEEQARFYFQKRGLFRFNPFERMGGEQSYSLALLNKQEDGLVITFLYTREGIRVYIKEVELGKGKEVELSKEEKEAVIKATKP